MLYKIVSSEMTFDRIWSVEISKTLPMGPPDFLVYIYSSFFTFILSGFQFFVTKSMIICKPPLTSEGTEIRAIDKRNYFHFLTFFIVIENTKNRGT